MALTEEEELELLQLEEEEAADAENTEEDAPGTTFLSKLRSGGLGAVEGATMGFADELAGAAKAAGIDPLSPVPLIAQPIIQAGKDISNGTNPVDRYRQARDFVRAKMEAARAENPKSFMGGQFGGAAASMLIPGMAPVRGAKALQIAKMGSAIGAAQGLGESEADLTHGDVAGAAKDTASGAAAGALISGAGSGVGKALKFAGNKVGQAVEHISGIPKWLANLARREGPSIFNAEGTEQSITNAVDKVQDTITSYRKEAGRALGAVKEELGIATPLREQAEEIAARGIHDLKPEEVVRQTLGLIDNAKPQGRDMLKTMVETRQAIDDLVDFSRKGIKPISGKQEAILKDLRGALNEKISQVTETPMTAERSVMGVPTGQELAGATRNIGQELRAAEGQFAQAADTFETLRPRLDTHRKVMASVKADLQEGLRSIDPDLQALQAVPGGQEAFGQVRNEVARFLFKTADPQGGGTLTLLAKTLGLTPERAGRFLAASGKGLDDFVAAHPRALEFLRTLEQTAARGGQSLAVANFVLQQRDPEYAAMVSDLTEGGK